MYYTRVANPSSHKHLYQQRPGSPIIVMYTEKRSNHAVFQSLRYISWSWSYIGLGVYGFLILIYYKGETDKYSEYLNRTAAVFEGR